MNSFRRLLEDNLEQAAVATNVAPMEAYMKGRFKYLGVKSSPRKLALRNTISQAGLPADEEFESAIKELWSSPYREVHYCAQELVDRKKWWKRVESIDLLEHLMRNNQWWDSIDYIAATLVGFYYRHHGVDGNRVRNWNNEKDMWVIRTSILFQLKYKESTDLKLLDDLMIPHLGSNEFFIQKAIGWMLRQVSKTNPSYVEGFVQDHNLKPVSYREAIKYI